MVANQIISLTECILVICHVGLSYRTSVIPLFLESTARHASGKEEYRTPVGGNEIIKNHNSSTYSSSFLCFED